MDADAAVDPRPIAVTIGWLSLASGLAMLAAPRLMARIYSLPPSAGLVRALGTRDVLIGAGLVVSRGSRGWMVLRAAGEAVDGLFIVQRSPAKAIAAWQLAWAELTMALQIEPAVRPAAQT